MKMIPVLRPVAAGAALLLTLAAAPVQGGLTALGGIERGEWTLKGSDGSVRKICLNNPASLIQLRHPGMQCAQTVIENGRETATVRYECTGRGNGQTTIGVETARLVHVTTSGIRDGSPFYDDIEARKSGPCG